MTRRRQRPALHTHRHLRTLTNLYNARPQWLADAHRDLDGAVAAPTAKLLELNLARAKTEAGPARLDLDDDA